MTKIETVREYRREALEQDGARAAGEAALIRLATRLYVLRESRKLTQEELAARSGFDQATISDIENGDANPTTRTLGRLAAGLDVDVGALLDNRPVGVRYGSAVMLREDVKWQGRTGANRTATTKIRVTSTRAIPVPSRQKVGVG